MGAVVLGHDMPVRVVMVSVHGTLVGMDGVEWGEGLEHLAGMLQEECAGFNWFLHDIGFGWSLTHDRL